MKSRWIAASTFLQAHFLATDAQMLGLTDPKLCYLMDGILFFYAIIVTALFFREKLIKRPAEDRGQGEDPYMKINPATQDTYNMYGSGGGKRGNQRAQDNSIYNDLQKDKMNEAYSGIGVKQQQPRKKAKGNDTVYQGLNAAPRDTYDALQMQPMRGHL